MRSARLLLFGILSTTTLAGVAQRVVSSNSNIWFSHWGDHYVAKKWSVHSEFHIRRAERGAIAQQLLIRPAVNFHLNEQVMFTAGYSYYENYPFGDYPIRFSNWEHHGFGQVQFDHALGKLKLWHRYRYEQRFLARVGADPNGEEQFNGYGNSPRFRYRVWLTYPLGKGGRFSANFYDEIFLTLGSTAPPDRLGQNRASLLLGYRPNARMNLMVGYLHQTLSRSGAALGQDLLDVNSTFHTVLIYNLDLRKKEPPGSPAGS